MRTRPYRVVCSQRAGMEAWLSARRGLLTASDVATFLGKNPWRTREQLIAEKAEAAGRSYQSPAAWWGDHLEVPNMRGFAIASGCRVRPTRLLLARKDIPLGCTLDGLMTRRVFPPRELTSLRLSNSMYSQFDEDTGIGVCEMKQTSDRNGSAWKQGIPEQYWIQVQVQMYVTGLTWGAVVCKIGASDMRWHRVVADDNFHFELPSITMEYQECLTKI